MTEDIMNQLDSDAEAALDMPCEGLSPMSHCSRPGTNFGGARGWAYDELAELKRMRDEGWSGTQIAAKLGRSRNSVIGKLHRLGLPSVNKLFSTTPAAIRSRIRRERKRNGIAAAPKAKKAKVKPAWHPPSPPKRPIMQAAEISSDPLPPTIWCDFMDLNEATCRYPYGDGPFVYCGNSSVAGLPYCDHHCRLAYQPAAVRWRP